jgi:hypothetical protein
LSGKRSPNSKPKYHNIVCSHDLLYSVSLRCGENRLNNPSAKGDRYYCEAGFLGDRFLWGEGENGDRYSCEL